MVKVAPYLDAVSHNEWDGEDMLSNDRMWVEVSA